MYLWLRSNVSGNGNRLADNPFLPLPKRAAHHHLLSQRCVGSLLDYCFIILSQYVQFVISCNCKPAVIVWNKCNYILIYTKWLSYACFRVWCASTDQILPVTARTNRRPQKRQSALPQPRKRACVWWVSCTSLLPCLLYRHVCDVLLFHRCVKRQVRI